MLHHLRSGSKSTLLKAFFFTLLLLAMAGLAMMDVQGMFRKATSGAYVAKYDGGQITVPEFDRLLRTTLREQKIKEIDAYRAGIPQQVLKGEIDKRLFARAAYDMGLKISDKEAAKQVKQIISPLTAQGASEKEALDHVLRVYNINEAQLVASIKEQLSVQKLIATVASTPHAPQQLINDALRYYNETRRGEYFTIGTDDIGEIATPSNEELKAFYETVADQYATPEYRRILVLQLDKTLIGNSNNVSEDEAKQYYDENIDSYTTDGKVTFSQAVAKDEESAKKIYGAVKSGKALKDSAKEFGGNYVDAQDFDKASIMSELGDAAFSGKAGETLAPVKSALGWHIMSIEKISPPTTKPFSAVKAEIVKTLSHDKVLEALYEIANQVDDDIAGGKSLKEIAKERTIAIKTLDVVDAYGFNKEKYQPYSGLPLYSKILETGFNLQEGEVSQMLETPEGSFIIVSAENITKPQRQPFEKIRSKILTRWMENQEIKALSNKTLEVMTKLQEEGVSFKQVAKSMKKEITSTQPIRRGASKKETGTDPQVIKTLFSLVKEGDVSPVSGNKHVKILKFADRNMKDAKEYVEKEVEQITSYIKEALKQDILDQYRISLLKEYKVEINAKLLQDMYNPNNEDLLE